MTKKGISGIFWGVVLIAVGGLALAGKQNLINFDLISDQGWVVVFAIASAAFFLSYFLNGVQKWGWLFPAFICAALALTIWMAIAGMDGSFVGVPILASVALPFYVGFALDRKNWGLLIPAWVMTVLAVITLFADTGEGNWIGALFLFSVGLPFLVVYLRDRSRQWALIPAWVTTILAIITLFAESAEGEWIGAMFLYAVGLPFLVIYLADRSRKWALIPAAVLGVVGTIPLLVGLFGDNDAVAVGIMLLFSAPFFVVYFWSKSNWWALIPAGVFASIAAVVLISLVAENQPWVEAVSSGVLFLGFGLTFGALWLRRGTQPTDWAKYPAVGLFTAAVVAFALGNNFQAFWAVALIAVGAMLVLASLLPKREQKPPKPGDQA
jgi:hypothetical protein